MRTVGLKIKPKKKTKPATPKPPENEKTQAETNQPENE